MENNEHLFDQVLADINARCKASGRTLKLQYRDHATNPRWTVLLSYQNEVDFSTYLPASMTQTELSFYLQGILMGLVPLSSTPQINTSEVEEMRQAIIKALNSIIGAFDAAEITLDKVLAIVRKKA